MRSARTLRLILGLLACTLVGCASIHERENDTLSDYRQELAQLVATGVLTKEDAEKFYRIATLEMERRAAQRQLSVGRGSALSPVSSEPSDPTAHPTGFGAPPRTEREL